MSRISHRLVTPRSVFFYYFFDVINILHIERVTRAFNFPATAELQRR